MSHQFELALRQYVAVFDGKNDAPEEFQAKFDALYGPKYTYVPKGAKADQKGWDCIGMELTDQEPIDRAAFFEAEKAKVFIVTCSSIKSLVKSAVVFNSCPVTS